MSNWEEVRKSQLVRIETASALIDRAAALCHQASADVPPELTAQVEKLRAPLDRQLRKLRDNQFHVAVIGTEKSGKSLLLNAWLGVEVLPSADKRCTYTTSEIWSAPTEAEQCYVLEFFTREEFNAREGEKREALSKLAAGHDADLLRTDLEEARALRPQIDAYLGKPQSITSFASIADIRAPLEKFIASDRAAARAIRRIIVKTVALRAARDIVFHDVPGFDSPVQIHQEQAKKMLGEADAILYAKDIARPDLVGPEVSMLSQADLEDPHVKVANKTFVALTQFDKCESRKRVDHLQGLARGSWQQVPADRVIPVSAPAHIFLKRSYKPGGFIEENGAGIQRRIADYGLTDNVDALKERVNNFIDNDRAAMLQRRCEGLTRDVQGAVAQVQEVLRRRYPESIESLKHGREASSDAAFNKWWAGEWTRILHEFDHYYVSSVMPKDAADKPADDHPKLKKMKEEYAAAVDAWRMRVTLGTRDALVAAYTPAGLSDDGVVLPRKAHHALRDALNKQALNEVHTLVKDLSVVVGSVIDEVATWIEQRMWGCPDVRDRLFGDRAVDAARVRSGLESLFLRFSRPAITLFMAAPRGERAQFLERYRRDLSILADYYEGDTSKKHLDGFLRLGRWVAIAAEATGHAPPGTAGVLGKMSKLTASKAKDEDDGPSPWTKPRASADSQAEVVEEILADLDALVDYLKNSVFTAAGFIPFSRQELDRVRRRFEEVEDQERGWHTAVRALHRRSPCAVAGAPDLVSDFENRVAIVNDLAEVTALAITLSGGPRQA